ncbi:uncharacterized protein METZ01_LOCUS7739 [marine metagenome]|uniref:Uncharacterized protein n=1 Tax=marine metagenome TaxID=408172 RepID=A0A381NK04_9ZZZZ
MCEMHVSHPAGSGFDSRRKTAHYSLLRQAVVVDHG